MKIKITGVPELKKGGNWIPGNLHKGRCTPLGKPGCPPGSPQYNLAKTFKKHHGFHKKEDGGEYTPFEDLNPTSQLQHDNNDFNYPDGGQLSPQDYMYWMGGYDGGGGIGGMGFYNPDMAYARGGDVHDKPGGSNVGKKHFANGQPRTGPYVGPSGGAPAGSYPVPDIKHARAALSLAHHAPNPGGIKAAVYRKYPQLKHMMGGDMSVPDLHQPFDKLMNWGGGYLREIPMAYGGESRWERTALMDLVPEHQSGGGMSSEAQQDWGFNPAAANISNYFGAYQSAKNAYDPSRAITNFAAATNTAMSNKSSPQYQVAQVGTQVQNQYGYRNPDFGTYGVNTNRGISNWLPLNYMTGHHDYLPSPQHRIQGNEENLRMPKGSYLAGADLKYGWLDKSSPKNIALHFRSPYGQYNDINPGDLDNLGSSRISPNRSTSTTGNPPYQGHGYAGTPDNYNARPIYGHTAGGSDSYDGIMRQVPQWLKDMRLPGSADNNGQLRPYPATNSGSSDSQFSDFMPMRSGPISEEYNTPSVQLPQGWTNKLAGFRYGGYFQDGSQVDPTYMFQYPGMHKDVDQTDIYGNDAYGGLSDPASHMSTQDVRDIVPAIGSTPGQTINLKRKNQYNGEDLANWGLAGINALTSFAGQKDITKRQQDLNNRTHADMVFNALPQNMRSRGDYDTNSGAFRPDQDVPTQFMAQPGLRKMGGSSHCNCGGFEDGGTYYLDDDEIENIKAQGGQVDYLD